MQARDEAALAAGDAHVTSISRPAAACAAASRRRCRRGATHSTALLAASACAEQYPKIKVKVNGRQVEVPEGSSILTACSAAGAYVSAWVLGRGWLLYHRRLQLSCRAAADW